MILAVAMHELPHEVGDFAILVQNGFSPKSAFLAQWVSALGALCGCWAGLVLSAESSPTPILGFTAGGFIYISGCSILPELLSHASNSTLVQTVREILGMLFGILIMIFVIYIE